MVGISLASAALQVAAAFLGTMAFALLFGVPSQYYLFDGITGGLGWLAYLLILPTPLGAVGATFIATLLVVLAARVFAVRRRCPSMVFMIPGIFPLVPGAGIYWTTYYLVVNQRTLAWDSGLMALKCTGAIVLGIVLVYELPNGLFKLLKHRRPA